MSRNFYVQQQGHSEVRIYRPGEWVEADWEGKRFHFRLQPFTFGGLERLLLRFRDSACCQQALLRLEDERILFKSAYTVAAQRFAPRRTAVESLGVREGDLLLGSDVWSVDLSLSSQFARPASVILRASSAAGLLALPFGASRLAVLSENSETAIGCSGPLKVLSPEQLRSREPLAATFFGDDILYELTNLALGDERAHLRLAAVGYVLPPALRRVTLGGGEEFLVRLYTGVRHREDEESSWNIWFEALRCSAAPGTVLSAVGRSAGAPSDAEEFDALLESFKPGWAPPSPPPPPVETSQVSAPAALVDKSFVLNKCEEVLALLEDRPEIQAEARRLRTLLAQEDYHQASILAEQLRPRSPEAGSTAPALDHGRRFRIGAAEMFWLDRRRLPRQLVPEVQEFPGMVLLAEPQELCRLRAGQGLEVAAPGSETFLAVPELRFGRRESPAGPDHISLPPGNLSVSSQAARIFVEAGELCIAPWRESLFEGDVVIKNFQLVLEHADDRSPLADGDFVVLGNLVLDFLREAAADGPLICRLRGTVLDRSEEGFPVGEGARLRFRPGAQLLEGSQTEEGGAYRVGPYRFECRPSDGGAVLLVHSGAGPLIRFGRGAGGMLCYSQRKRMTRVRRAPLYPVTEELFAGSGWQADRDGAGVELLFERSAPCYFRLAVRRSQDGAGEIFCQASASSEHGSPEQPRSARHLRAGLPSPDSRLEPGDELVCPPATLRVVEGLDAEGLELALDLASIELPAGQSGWIAGLDAEVPEDEPWILRLPPPFPRSARVRWTGAGHYQLEGAAEALDREIPGFAVAPEPAFQLFDAAFASGGRLRVGGPGSPAEILHHELPPGAMVATLDASPAGLSLLPISQDRRLWHARGAHPAEPVPMEGMLLQEGDRFGMGAAELHFGLQAVG